MMILDSGLLFGPPRILRSLLCINGFYGRLHERHFK